MYVVFVNNNKNAEMFYYIQNIRYRISDFDYKIRYL